MPTSVCAFVCVFVVAIIANKQTKVMCANQIIKRTLCPTLWLQMDVK